MKNNTLANLENFVLGKRFLGENENQKMKQKIQTQVTYNNRKITFFFTFIASSLEFHCFTSKSEKKKDTIIFPRLIYWRFSQALTQN